MEYFYANKRIKIGVWAFNGSRAKTSLYLYKQNMNTQDYLEVQNKTIEEVKEP